MGLKAAAKRLILPFARQGAKLYYHDRKVLIAKARRKLVGNQNNIIQTHTGELHHAGGKYALFLIWQPKRIAWYVENALASLNEAGINVIAIVNHTLSDEQLSQLKQKTHAILLRDNTGFDIGGYRDASLFLAEADKHPSRVIYMNDSIYYFKNGLTELFNRLANSSSDICGTFENWEIHYHIQSFCFSVSGRLFMHNKFQGFWDRYLPVNSRLWAINSGEVGLSRTMIPIADSIDVVYRSNDLREGLRKKPKNELIDYVKYLPNGIRISYPLFDELPKEALINEYVDRIYVRSQIHTGGFLFRSLVGSPLLKRDLLFRLQFTLDEIEYAVRETGDEGHMIEIMTDFRKKGLVNHLPVVKRLQAARGIL